MVSVRQMQSLTFPVLQIAYQWITRRRLMQLSWQMSVQWELSKWFDLLTSPSPFTLPSKTPRVEVENIQMFSRAVLIFLISKTSSGLRSNELLPTGDHVTIFSYIRFATFWILSINGFSILLFIAFVRVNCNHSNHVESLKFYWKCH